MSPLRVVLAQLAPRPRDIPANLRRIDEVLGRHAGADLVVLPELFLTGYETDDLGELALTLDAPAIGALRDACRRAGTALITGFVEYADATRFNSALVIGSDGRVAGVYRKTHLFGSETAAFSAGDELVPIDVDGVAVGLLICFDIEFPEPARTLALRGAEVLVSIAANMEPYLPDHELASRARSLDNRLPHIYVNMVGQTGPLTFVGGSRAVGPDGTVLGDAGNDETTIVCEIPLRQPVPPQVDYLRLLRRDGPYEAS
jgi:predicted amidohydrolase